MKPSVTITFTGINGKETKQTYTFNEVSQLEGFVVDTDDGLAQNAYDLFILAWTCNFFDEKEDDGDHYNGDVDSDINA